MDYCNVITEINLFDYKTNFLKSLGTDDIELELKKRKENDVYVKNRNVLYTDIYVELSEYETEILENLKNDELSTELIDRGYKVFNNEEYPPINLATKENICTILGLRKWSTKEQILSELNNIL